MYNRAILHLDLDAFFVSVEQLNNSSLRGKPIIVGGVSGRGVVTSCSYEARAYGIHSAMPINVARRLCPDAIFIRGDMENYSRHSRLITEIIGDKAPLFEKASIDEFYLDLSGMDRYFGCYQWATELRALIVKESGLPISFGLSVNKLVAKIGTGQGKPNGAIKVDDGTEKNFIAPLPVGKLPSVGQVTARKLNLMGVKTIKTLSEIPPKLLRREFGKPGISLWEKANAIDHSPVVPFTEKKSISSEHTFEKDTIDVILLKKTFSMMLDKLCFELRKAEKLTSCITIKIRYTDFSTYTKQCKLPHTASDKTIALHANQLFDALYNRRQLVRLIGIRFSDLVHGHYQIDLFEDTIKETKLLQQMDSIRKRFGKGALLRASGV
jgi:DNA polymerase IV